MVGIGNAPAIRGPRRGDIYLVEFEAIGGEVLQGPHPAVVVQTDQLERSSTVLVAPVTSRGLRRPDYVPPYLAWIARQESGLERDGWIKADQLFTRPVATLGPRVGRLSPDAMARVNASLRFVLGV